MALDNSQIERYSRQILLREIGGTGQAKLLDATVFILGAGGLGCPAALYLAAAGVGTLIIADSDRVDLSNLGRQILYNIHTLGKPKAEAAARFLHNFNADIRIKFISARVDANLLDDVLPQCHLVVDASDNFDTRYLLNTACFKHHRKLVSGAVLGFEGQIASFHHGVDPKAPCYRCLYPVPPEQCTANCTTAGILGGVAGIVGSLQAVEAVKGLLDIGTPLNGELLLINTLDNMFHRVKIPKNPNCPICTID